MSNEFKKEILQMRIDIFTSRINAMGHYINYSKEDANAIKLILKMSYKICKEFNLKMVGSGEKEYQFNGNVPVKIFEDGYSIRESDISDDISYNNTYDLVFAGKLTNEEEESLKKLLEPTHYSCEEDVSGFFNFYYFGFDFTKTESDEDV